MAENSTFRRNLLVVAALHVGFIGVVFFFTQCQKKKPVEQIAWMDGSVGGAEAEGGKSEPAAPAPEVATTPAREPEPEPVAPPEPEPKKMAVIPPPPPIEPPVPSEIVTPAATPPPKPVTPKPVTPKPVTPKPVTPKPVTPKVATPKPATPKAKVPVTPQAKTTPPATPKSKSATATPKTKAGTPKPEAKTAAKNTDGAAAAAAPGKAGGATTSKAGKGATRKPGDNGPGEGNGEGPGKVGDGKGKSDFGWYNAMLGDVFKNRWSQPTSVVRSGTDFVTTLKIRISKDGVVSHREIVRSSGNPVMDESVLAAAAKVASVDPLPAGITGGDFYEITINFKLDQGN